MTTKPSIAIPDTQKFRHHFARRTAILLVPISIILSLLLGGLVYSRTTHILTEQANQQIGNFVLQVEDQLDEWLGTKQAAFQELSSDPSASRSIELILQSYADNSSYTTERNRLINQLAAYQSSGTPAAFDDVLLISPQGQVLAATQPEWENSSLSGEVYFSQITDAGGFTSFVKFNPLPFSVSENLAYYDVSLISIQPLGNPSAPSGYLVGLSASPSIQATLEANGGYLPDNNIFLVNENGDFAGITELTATDSLAPTTPNSSQQELAFNGLSANMKASEYTSSDGTNVLGLYAFYAPLNIGFVVESPYQLPSVFSSGIGMQTLLIIFAFALLLGGWNLYSAFRIANPVKELVTSVQQFAAGDWEARADLKRDDELGMLATAFNSFADELNNFYKSLENEVGERTQQLITTSELSNLATSAASLDDLLNRTVLLITERFDFFQTSIYLVDQSKEFGKLRAATGSIGKNLISQGYQIPISPGSPHFWVVQHNQPKVADENEMDFLDLDLMPGAKAKAILPIAIGMDVFGLLDVQATDEFKFNKDTIDLLKTLSNQLASAIQNFRLLEGTEVDLQQLNELFRASQTISRATTEDDVFKAIVAGVQQTSFYAAFYVAHPNGLSLLQPVDNRPYYSEQLPTEIPLSSRLTYMFFEENEPILIKDVHAPLVSIRPELLQPAIALNCTETALLPIIIGDNLQGLLILSAKDPGKITQNSIQPFLSFISLAVTGLDKVMALKNAQQTLSNFQTINELSNTIGNETDPSSLYPVIHNQIRSLLGEVDFYIALYDKNTNYIQIPYLFEGDEPLHIDPFPLGEGLTSIVIRTQKPLMLVERVEERALSLGAKIVGNPAKSWLGIPLIVAGDVIGIISVQDVENEHRFTNDDLVLLTTLSTTIASSIRSANLLAESEHRAFQLQTVAEISRETSSTLDRGELLNYALTLVQERFNFYHASVFIMDPSGEYAVVQESTGDAGKQMKAEGHRLKVGSQSIIGFVTENQEPLVVNDVTQDPTHRFNPLLPETRAELGIPILVGSRLLGALDVQSTVPFAFSKEDIEILQILADQLAIAITNADLFTETQEHLAQHRLIHHVTTVAASSTNIEDAMSSAVQGLRVTLGDRVSILLKDPKTNTLRVQAASGYDNDILGLKIKAGQGITGWAAEHSEAIIVNDVLSDPRYIPGNEAVRSEMAVPLVYRGELLGVLNIESDLPNAFDEHDQDILGTLAGSLSAIIVNTRLSERQRQLFDITSKIRQSVNMDTILETTANELSRALQTSRTRIQVGGTLAGLSGTPEGSTAPKPTQSPPSFGNGQDGEE